jgi:hypothetical protein
MQNTKLMEMQNRINARIRQLRQLRLQQQQQKQAPGYGQQWSKLCGLKYIIHCVGLSYTGED